MKNGVEEPYLIGERIYLRPIDKRDINKKYLSWLNDARVTRYMQAGLFPTTRRDLEQFYKKISKSKSDLMFSVLTKKGNIYLGNIKLGSINWVHRYADLGIMIGEKRYWKRGYGQEACRLLLEYAFKRLNLNKVILAVYGDHAPAIRTYKKVGFKIEGRIKRLLISDGRYVDKVIMGVSKDDFTKRLFPG